MLGGVQTTPATAAHAIATPQNARLRHPPTQQGQTQSQGFQVPARRLVRLAAAAATAATAGMQFRNELQEVSVTVEGAVSGWGPRQQSIT